VLIAATPSARPARPSPRQVSNLQADALDRPLLSNSGNLMLGKVDPGANAITGGGIATVSTTGSLTVADSIVWF